MNENILIVRKDLSTLFFLKYELEQLGYENIYLVNSFNDAIKKMQEIDFDIVITDFLLKGKEDGIHLAEYLQIKKIPFAFYLAEKNVEAEEYIKDEFDVCILYENNCFSNVISLLNNIFSKDIQIKTNHFDIQLIKEKYSLTKNEAKCLEILYLKNSILSHIQLQAELWPNTNRCEATLRSLVRRVRNKFGEEVIESIYGLGYKVNVKKECLLT